MLCTWMGNLRHPHVLCFWCLNDDSLLVLDTSGNCENKTSQKIEIFEFWFWNFQFLSNTSLRDALQLQFFIGKFCVSSSQASIVLITWCRYRIAVNHLEFLLKLLNAHVLIHLNASSRYITSNLISSMYSAGAIHLEIGLQRIVFSNSSSLPAKKLWYTH